METKSLEIFNQIPFLIWVKGQEGKWLRGNRSISKLVGEDVVGNNIDRELIWAYDADVLQTDDKLVFETNASRFKHQIVDQSSRFRTTLNVYR